jgi:molybdopterin converting factor subunit 1
VKVEVLLFAAARQAAGCDKVTVELSGGSSVADLKREIAAVCPALESVIASSMIAINHEYVRDDSVVPPNAEIALIPPVSGG